MPEPKRSECTPPSECGDVEIQPKQWASFLESFSQQHEGWLVSISLFSGLDTSIEVSSNRLERITTDGPDARGPIRISTIRGDGSHLLHQVENPVHLTFKRDRAGAHEGLDITSVDGSVTKLRFRMPAHPETLDGVLF